MQGVPRVLVADLDGRNARRHQAQPIVRVALDLRPKPAGVGDDKPEIADLRDIDARIVDLVEDAEANGEPQPRRPERATPMSLALLVQVGGMPGEPGA